VFRVLCSDRKKIWEIRQIESDMKAGKRLSSRLSENRTLKTEHLFIYLTLTLTLSGLAFSLLGVGGRKGNSTQSHEDTKEEQDKPILPLSEHRTLNTSLFT
jgi:hypothetical protein